MDEDELVRQKADVTGEAIATCDLCGLPVSATILVPLTGRVSETEPVKEIRVCPDCRAAIEAGEVPFDAQIRAGLQAPEE